MSRSSSAASSGRPNSSRGSVRTPLHAKEDFPHFSVKSCILDFIPCTSKTLRTVRLLSSEWRVASERCTVWTSAPECDCFASRSSTSVLLRLKATDAGGTTGVSTLLNPSDDTTTILHAKINSTYAKISAVGLLKAFQTLEWVQHYRSRSLLLLRLDLVDQKEPFADSDTIAAVFPSCLRELLLGPKIRFDRDQIHTIAIGSNILNTLRIDGWATDNMIMSFAANCPLLTSISLRQPAGITDAALVMVGQRLRVLKELFISECDTIGDVGVCAIARGCPTLEKLCLPFCPKFTDLALREVGISLVTQLVALDISGNTRVSTDSLLPLLEDQIKLQHLNLSFCALLVTTEVMEMMVRTCWCLTTATFAFSNVLPLEEGPTRDYMLKMVKELQMRGCDIMV